MSSASVPSRRERIRAQTLIEIREHGYEQITQGGPSALSLNGIAKAMGMSGPSLYRYFSSRDELLATLVTESYEDLANTLAAAAHDARRRAPEGRLRAVLNASRDWALRSPHRYRLVFGSSYGTGALDPERIIPAAHRSMTEILTALAELGAPSDAPAVADTVLARELAAWGNNPGAEALPPGVLLLGLTAWTRLHGIISLEIEGVFTQLGVDPTRLYDTEIDHLIEQRTRAHTT
jgi:AcrR family transcriptional regulator